MSTDRARARARAERPSAQRSARPAGSTGSDPWNPVQRRGVQPGACRTTRCRHCTWSQVGRVRRTKRTQSPSVRSVLRAGGDRDRYTDTTSLTSSEPADCGRSCSCFALRRPGGRPGCERQRPRRRGVWRKPTQIRCKGRLRSPARSSRQVAVSRRSLLLIWGRLLVPAVNRATATPGGGRPPRRDG